MELLLVYLDREDTSSVLAEPLDIRRQFSVHVDYEIPLHREREYEFGSNKEAIRICFGIV